MTHYGIVQWVDFARGVASEEDRGPMQQHLASGCFECGQVFSFCGRVARFSEAMAAGQVPDSALRCARAILPVRRPRSKRAFPIPLKLIYDSFLAPAPVGLRSSWQVGWQALYRAGDCCVDLRIEPELRSSRAAVIGQISNRTLPEMGMNDIPVCLKSGKDVIAETLSNRFGEFQLEYDQQPRLHLWIYLEGGSRSIHLPLRMVAGEKPVRGRRSLGCGKRRKAMDPR
jgi:hypothetical protein